MTRWLRLCLLLTVLGVPGSAAAQSPRAAAAAPGQGILQEQNGNQELPIQIDAATLEVHDKNKMATFSGDVVVVQGDTTIKCQSLVVFYGAEHGPAGQAVANARPADAAPEHQQGASMPQGAKDIRRIEARGGVTVISKDQNATGDLGVYDLKKKTITLTGNVTVSQGKNVLHGDKVVVDTATGNAHFESAGTAPSRVRALILPGKNGTGSPNIMSVGPPKLN